MTVISYNGNQNLKPYGAKTEYTEEQLKEYLKCAADPKYFIDNYVKIVTLDHGLIQMKLRDYQVEMVDKITHNRRVAMKAPRQSGKCISLSTTVTVRDKKTGKISTLTVGKLYGSSKEDTAL